MQRLHRITLCLFQPVACVQNRITAYSLAILKPVHQEILQNQVNDATQGIEVYSAREVGAAETELLLGLGDLELEIGPQLHDLFVDGCIILRRLRHQLPILLQKAILDFIYACRYLFHGLLAGCLDVVEYFLIYLFLILFYLANPGTDGLFVGLDSVSELVGVLGPRHGLLGSLLLDGIQLEAELLAEEGSFARPAPFASSWLGALIVLLELLLQGHWHP